MCGRVAQDGRPSGEPAPSAVLAGKHHDGGEGPGGSRKLAAQIKPTAGPRCSEEGLRLLASQTLSLQGAGFPPSSWLSLCFVVTNKPEMKRIYNKTPASPSIRWSCSREGAEQWCCCCPRTWPAGPGKARQGGQPAQGETSRPSAALRPHPCLRTQLPEALLAPKASAEGRLPPPPLRHTGSPKGPPELAQPSAQLRLQAEAELPPPLLAACQDSNTAVGPPLAPGPGLRLQGRQKEGEGEKQRAVLVKDDVDVFRWERGESGEPQHCLDDLAALQNGTELSDFGLGGQGFQLTYFFYLLISLFLANRAPPCWEKKNPPCRANP